MSENFLKFKKRFCAFRIIRSVMVAVSAGLALSGVWLMLIRLAVLNFGPLTTIFVGIGVALSVGCIIYLLSGRSDKSLAEELDLSFGLDARVQTMIEYSGETGEMISLQRQDADRALSEIPLKSYKFKRPWIYIVALIVSSAILAVGFVVPDLRDHTPPEEIELFELSEPQERAMLELIKRVEDSEMEEEFRTPIVKELQDLLSQLREIGLKEDMIAAVTKSMAVIMDITYESSTATEMLNALWDTDDVYLGHLAKRLDVSDWTDEADWGDFAERIREYASLLMGDGDEEENTVSGTETLKNALLGMTGSIDAALLYSGLPEDDEMYLAVKRMILDETSGLALILNDIDSLSADEARTRLMKSLDDSSDGSMTIARELFNAVSLNRRNAIVGEEAMRKLKELFSVPVPAFERPTFRTGGGGSDNSDTGDKNPGGAGGGIAYGSDDLVLDPMTGELVKYGDIIKIYCEKMYERLDSDLYTEEQKKVIRKYFELLLGGLEKEEGN